MREHEQLKNAATENQWIEVELAQIQAHIQSFTQELESRMAVLDQLVQKEK